MREVHSRPQGDPLDATETTTQLEHYLSETTTQLEHYLSETTTQLEHYLSVHKVQPGIITQKLSRLTNWQAAVSAHPVPAQPHLSPQNNHPGRSPSGRRSDGREG